ncbi:MAG: protease, partial [Myxococcaceae bacterium]
RWVDREVVEDGNLITSRKPDDLEAFSAALLRQVKNGIAPRIGSAQAAESNVDRAPPMH